MKKILFVFVATSLIACNQEKEENKSQVKKEVKETSEEKPKKEKEFNVDSIVNNAQEYRNLIEGELEELTQKEGSTSEMREQIKQKWSAIHFYKKDGNVVRIKTYPHDGISTRTEEFYFKDNQLVCAVIEDQGTKGKGKDEIKDDKTYYYFNDKMIKEVKHSEEKEYAIKDSDAERLLQEAKEYLEYQ